MLLGDELLGQKVVRKRHSFLKVLLLSFDLLRQLLVLLLVSINFCWVLDLAYPTIGPIDILKLTRVMIRKGFLTLYRRSVLGFKTLHHFVLVLGERGGFVRILPTREAVICQLKSCGRPFVLREERLTSLRIW